MALSNGHSSAEPPRASLSTTLKNFANAQGTRTSISKEYDEAFNGHISTPQTVTTVQLDEVIRITTIGLLQTQEEIEESRADLVDRWGRKDLADLVGKVQDAEKEKLTQTVQRDQLRRINLINSRASAEGLDRDYDEAIRQATQRIAGLRQMINEYMDEIRIEMAELSTTETD